MGKLFALISLLILTAPVLAEDDCRWVEVCNEDGTECHSEFYCGSGQGDCRMEWVCDAFGCRETLVCRP